MALEGKVALVTGASRPKGIGRHTALTLAGHGADVVVTGFHHLEGARFNITANSVVVGICATDGYDLLPEPVRQAVEKKTVFRRPAHPQEIADAIAYLCSDSAAYMTGTAMNMMGGLELFVF